ncbi:aminotransferase class V-fold PLP-dependent enzyme [Candidatus Bathyarchaeota archaeon]|nr:aminotransferase class V-fold PLP-dependent enzyme [Candidatus Bathyarchaeota archaeon]
MDDLINPFKKYGLRRVINAATSLTNLGGSIPDSYVIKEMIEASKCFVDIVELQKMAGEYIAEITGAESGLPVAGAVCGLMLGAAACIMKGTELENYDPIKHKGGWSHLSTKLPVRTEGLKTEFIVQKTNRNVYDYSVELAGGKFVETGSKEWELDSAYNKKTTACYYYTARNLKGSLPLEKVIKIAHKNNLPVLIDAAAELPPKRKLRYYISQGADLVVYSGGKHIAGPNNSGILAGRSDLIKLAHLQSYPFNGVGRAAKMSRETIIGLIAAIKIYLEHDEKKVFQEWMNKAEWMSNKIKEIPGIKTGIVFQRVVEDGEPMTPLCYLKIDENIAGISGKTLSTKLREDEPSIASLYEPFFLTDEVKGLLLLNPQYLLENEEYYIVEKIKKLLKH